MKICFTVGSFNLLSLSTKVTNQNTSLCLTVLATPTRTTMHYMNNEVTQDIALGNH